MKLLLVDDEVEFVATLAERLSLRGIQADWTTKPVEAISLVQEKHYDLVVLDVKMPIINGINLKSKLQDLSPNLNFIFLTGHGSEEEFQVGSSETGAEYYLLKPLQIDELVMKIHAAVGKGGGSGNE